MKTILISDTEQNIAKEILQYTQHLSENHQLEGTGLIVRKGRSQDNEIILEVSFFDEPDYAEALQKELERLNILLTSRQDEIESLDTEILILEKRLEVEK